MHGQKVLVTGAAGQIAFPICVHLARDNEVWGLDLFGTPGSRQRLDDLGVTALTVDLASGDFGDLPDDFDYVLHLAAYVQPSGDYDAALRVNAEGTGLLLAHCRRARAALVMSTASVYEPHDDPWYRRTETDALGDTRSPMVPTYSLTKIAEEAVARTSARLLDLPVIVARMNTAYGANGGVPAMHLDSIIEGRTIFIQGEPATCNPTYQGDINEQIDGLLGAASVPATIVNWAGDESVAQRDWCEYLGELTGRPVTIEVRPIRTGGAIDVTKRLSITGPCRTSWREGMRLTLEGRYPDGPDGPRRPGVGGPHAAFEAYTRRESGSTSDGVTTV
jgi:nucleoside-diphosphate-sugar epimerase